MLVDVYQDRGRGKILIIEDGKTIPRLTDEGQDFLDDLVFERKISINELPTALSSIEVMQSLKERGHYAARRSSTLTEVKVGE